METVKVFNDERSSFIMPHDKDWHSTEDFLEIMERNLNKKLTVTYQ